MLALTVKEGDSIFVDGEPLRIDNVENFHTIDVSFRGKNYRITHDQQTALSDTPLKLQTCAPENNPRARHMVLFDCPKSIRIMRESLMRA